MPGILGTLGQLPRAILPGKKKGEKGVSGVMHSLAGQLAGRPKRKAMPSKKPPAPITSATSSKDAAARLRPKKMPKSSGIGSGQTAGQKRAIIQGIEEDYR